MKPSLIRAHRGISFRSPIEVKWARTFSALNWTWQYEHDRLINGSLVDFSILAATGKILCEVNANLNFPDDTARKMFDKAPRGWDGWHGDSRAIRPPLRYDLIILAAEIMPVFHIPAVKIQEHSVYPLHIGWMHEKEEQNPNIWHEIFFCETEIGRIGFFPSDGTQQCRITSLRKYCLFTCPVTTVDVNKIWNEAANDNLDPTWRAAHPNEADPLFSE